MKPPVSRVAAGIVLHGDAILWAKAYPGRTHAQVRGFARAAIKCQARFGWGLRADQELVVRTWEFDLRTLPPDIHDDRYRLVEGRWRQLTTEPV